MSNRDLHSINRTPYYLSELTGDVSISSPTSGQALVYNATSGKWENGDDAGDAHTLGSNLHTDVTLTSVTDNELLSYDSGSGLWINQTAAELGISTTDHTHADYVPYTGATANLDLGSYDLSCDEVEASAILSPMRLTLVSFSGKIVLDPLTYIQCESKQIKEVADPTDAQDVATKNYVDGKTWDADDIVSGTFDDARISESSVTQHEAALSITESQISDLTHYTDADVASYLQASGFQLNDNVKGYFGTGSDASIYFDGSDFYINARGVTTSASINFDSDVNINTVGQSDHTFITVRSDTAKQAGFKLLGTGDTDGWIINRQATNHDLQFYSYGISDAAMTIDYDTGYLGIGTAAPDRILHIRTSTGVQYGANYCRIESADQDGLAGFEFKNDAQTYTIGVVNLDTFVIKTSQQFGGNAALSIHPTSGISIGDTYESNDPGASCLSVAGNVSIGSTSASRPYGTDPFLEIQGASNPALVIHDTGQASAYSLVAESNYIAMYYGTNKSWETRSYLEETEFNQDVWIFPQTGNARCLFGDSTSPGQYGGFRWQTSDDTLGFGHSGSDTDMRDLIIGSDGYIQLKRDNQKLLFGAGNDASIYYNGSNLIINPKEVGSGVCDIQGVTYMANTSGIKGTATGTDNYSYFGFYESNGSIRHGYIGEGSTGNSNITVAAEAGDLRLSASSNIRLIPASGQIYVNADNYKLRFGSGADVSMYYDGTNFIINPKEVGSGVLSILGDVDLNSNDFTTAGDVSLTGNFRVDGVSPASYGLIQTDKSNSWVGINADAQSAQGERMLINGNVKMGDTGTGTGKFFFNTTVSYFGSDVTNSITASGYNEVTISTHAAGSGNIYIKPKGTSVWTITSALSTTTKGIAIGADNQKLLLGAGNDASIYFDGSDMYIQSENVTANDELVIKDFTNVKIGDGTNYAQIASDGEVTLVGTARVTKEIEIPLVGVSAGASGTTTAAIGNYVGESFDINDYVLADIEIPHDWDSTTDLTVKIYWAINEAYATNSGEVQWQIEWASTPSDETEALDAPTHTGTIDYGDQDIPATAKYLTKTAGATIAAASLAEGDYLGLKLSRIALDGGSNPTADPIAFRLEIEYTSNKLGETL